MEQLQVNATFPSISPDAADEFKQLAAEALATIRGEPGTLQHDWFFSDDGAQCVVRETYASSDAFLAHLAGAGPLLGRLVELGGGLELDAVRRAVSGAARRRRCLPAADLQLQPRQVSNRGLAAVRGPAQSPSSSKADLNNPQLAVTIPSTRRRVAMTT